MIRLTRVELKRLLARRVTWVVLLGGLALSSLVLVGIHDQTQWMTPENQEISERDFKRIHTDWVKNHERDEKACRAGMSEADRESPIADEICEIPEPQRDMFVPDSGVDHLYREASLVLIPIAAFVSFLLGASFVAAEFSTRSISTWLTFEPRRGLVAASKLTTATLGAAVLAAMLLVYAGAGIWLIAWRAELTTDVPSDTIRSILSMWVRIPAVAALAGLLGAAVALLLRHSAAALGVLIAYVIGAEAMIRSLVPGLQQWLVSSNVLAFVHGQHTYPIADCGPRGCLETNEVVSFAQGSTYLVVVGVLLTAVAVVSFRRRDVS